MIKIKDGEVRLGGCMCELCSDIPPNWNDIRTKFGYILCYMQSALKLREEKDETLISTFHRNIKIGKIANIKV